MVNITLKYSYDNTIVNKYKYYRYYCGFSQCLGGAAVCVCVCCCCTATVVTFSVFMIVIRLVL